MKRFIQKLCAKAGRRLLAVGELQPSGVFSGSIQVAGLKVADLKPLGGYHQPGVTKAGRLSFAGVCEGRKVKVYSSYSLAQNALRQEIQSIDFGICAFPALLAMDEHLVVEEWIEGASVSTLKGEKRRQAEQSVLQFLEENSKRYDLLAVAQNHRHAFCYLQDYLLARLGVWRHWDLVANFVSDWQARYAELSGDLPVYISHPDLSAANLIREPKTGRIVIIDNELIGVGPGWILDGRNSLLREDLHSIFLGRVPADFVDMTWRLRQIGSSLDANDFSRAKMLCESKASANSCKA